jgi:hypothetical protein
MDKKNGAPKRLSKTDKHDRLFEMIRMLTDREFTGYLKVNFSQGGIGRIEKLEELALNREQPKD